MAPNTTAVAYCFDFEMCKQTISKVKSGGPVGKAIGVVASEILMEKHGLRSEDIQAPPMVKAVK
jgi:hypothetical protein